MNVILALEQRGYINAIDFDVFVVDGTVNDLIKWKHADPKPTQSELDIMWNEYLAANPVDLNAIKDEAKRNVDQTSEETRLRYVTSGSSQAMTYQEKGDEAADYVANGYPVDLASYPFIQAEVNATGKTPTAAADDILAQKSAWIVIGAAVEEVRIGGKINIDAAVDEAAVNSIRDAALAALAVI